MATLYHRVNDSDLDTAIAVVDSVCLALQDLHVGKDRSVSINWSKVVFGMLLFDVISTMVVLAFVAWLVFIRF